MKNLFGRIAWFVKRYRAQLSPRRKSLVQSTWTIPASCTILKLVQLVRELTGSNSAVEL